MATLADLEADLAEARVSNRDEVAAAEAAVAKRKRRIARAALVAAAEKLAEPKDILGFVAIDEIVVGSDEEVDADQVELTVKEVIRRWPRLTHSSNADDHLVDHAAELADDAKVTPSMFLRFRAARGAAERAVARIAGEPDPATWDEALDRVDDPKVKALLAHMARSEPQFPMDAA